MHFGATLRLLRTDAGVSLRQLAAQVGVSSAYLSRIEHGRDHAPTVNRLAAIAHALELPASLLYELADRVAPLTSEYLERVPAANALFLEIARRRLTAAQLARVNAFIEREFPVPAAAPSAAQRLGKLLCAGHVAVGATCRDYDAALELAAATFTLESGRADPGCVAAALRRRERECSSALGDGVAAPHAVIPGARAQASMVLLAEPLQHATPDGRPLRVVIALLLDPAQATQLELLGQVAKLANDDVVRALAQATTPRDALKVLAARLA